MTATSLRPLPAAIDRGEFAERRRRAAAIADEAGLHGLLAWSSRTAPWAVQYLAGYQSGFQLQGNAATFGDRGFCALVLPVDGDPILVMDQRVGPDDVAVDDARTSEHLIAGVAGAVRDAGLADARLGLAGQWALLDRQRGELEVALGRRLRLTGVDPLIEPLARVKSPAEQAWVRHASAVGSAWMTAMMEAVEPGRTEADVVAAGLPVLLEAGGFPMDVVAGSGRPCRPQAERGIPGFDARRPLERGDLIRVDGFGPVRGYGCDLARSACVGAEPTDEQRAALEDTVAFVWTLLDAMRPGVSLGELNDLGEAWLVERGHPPHGYFEGFWPAFGHQLGLTTEGPFVTAGETAVLEPGMVMAIEIVMGTAATGGVSHEECAIVTGDGVDVITASCPARWW